jgi:hypothetical protein
MGRKVKIGFWRKKETAVKQDSFPRDRSDRWKAKLYTRPQGLMLIIPRTHRHSFSFNTAIVDNHMRAEMAR